MIYSKQVFIPYQPVLDHSIITSVKTRHTRLSLHQLNYDFVNYLKKLNVSVFFVEVFHLKPYSSGGIHIDSHLNDTDITKLNYIYGGSNSEMYWYTPNDETCGEKRVTAIKSNFISYTPEQVTKLHSQHLIGTNIVQVGIPHNVVNADQDRYCVSMAIRENRERITMDRAIEIFTSNSSQ